MFLYNTNFGFLRNKKMKESDLLQLKQLHQVYFLMTYFFHIFLPS
jgi:hypothetical protein